MSAPRLLEALMQPRARAPRRLVNARQFLSSAALVLAAGLAHAHKASDAYVALHVAGADIAGRVDIALRDLDRDLDLDADADDTLTWKEVRSRWPDIVALARAGLRLEADGRPCLADPADAPAAPETAPAITEHSDGHYAVLRLHWHCAADVHRLGVAYSIFARTDPTHRGIVRVGGTSGATPLLAVLSPGGAPHRFVLPAGLDATAGPGRPGAATADAAAPSADRDASRPSPSPSRQSAVPADVASRGAGANDPATAPQADDGNEAPSSFPGFVREGIHHILIGYDHILFLLSLLLPAVWVRRPARGAGAGADAARWSPAPALGPALANVLKVVTAFTVAHSITLALSVFDVVNPPSRWVESVIAASVVAAALNNLWPVISESRWKLTFVFGLVHGFGFASALKDAGLARGDLAGPLVGFNVGVEIGQLCIVGLVLPLAWSLRGTRAYRGAFAAGSLAIAAVAGLWLTQRAFDLAIIAG
jgi:hypothetical protein